MGFLDSLLAPSLAMQVAGGGVRVFAEQSGSSSPSPSASFWRRPALTLIRERGKRGLALGVLVGHVIDAYVTYLNRKATK